MTMVKNLRRMMKRGKPRKIQLMIAIMSKSGHRNRKLNRNSSPENPLATIERRLKRIGMKMKRIKMRHGEARSN